MSDRPPPLFPAGLNVGDASIVTVGNGNVSGSHITINNSNEPTISTYPDFLYTLRVD